MTQEDKKTSRRDVLKIAGGAFTGLAVAGCAESQSGESKDAAMTTGIDASTIADAEQLSGITYTDVERAQMVGDLEARLQALEQLRKVDKPNTLAPALTFDPRLPGVDYPLEQTGGVHITPYRLASKPSQNDIAFATIPQLRAWLRSRVITCRFITDIYLRRIEEHGPKLECFVTVMAERAQADADMLDREIADGNFRGPLHGIPYGLKDLFDAEGAPTSWGAAPYKDQAGNGDCAIVRKLKEAGAVLLGKTTCGALAYGDIWYGGVTRNPFDPREGSSGSSAGSASATAAGLCAFAIGTETLGSLVSPSMRCGTTALRPTFGRVSRAGGMALCWSLDKAGPITRRVEDTALVLAAINGVDIDDASTVAAGFAYDHKADISALTIGIAPNWYDGADSVEKSAMDAARKLGAKIVDFTPPDLPAGPLVHQLLAEAAAAFEDLTLSNLDDELTWQDDDAWPNSFRATRFLSAIDLVQIDRLRRRWMEEMHRAFEGIDVVVGPSYSSGMLTPTNFTGHPCLILRAGFTDTQPRSLFDVVENEAAPTARTPIGISLWAPLYGEGNMLAVGKALEDALGVAGKHPKL